MTTALANPKKSHVKTKRRQGGRRKSRSGTGQLFGGVLFDRESKLRIRGTDLPANENDFARKLVSINDS